MKKTPHGSSDRMKYGKQDVQEEHRSPKMTSDAPAPVPPSIPLGPWAGIVLAALTAISAHFTSVGKDQFNGTVEKVAAFEDGQYEAIVDLRRKVDFLFKRMLEVEASGAIKPPGPASFFNPPDPSDAGVEPDADASDFLPPVPPEKETKELDTDQNPYGMPVWEPLKKQMEPQK